MLNTGNKKCRVDGSITTGKTQLKNEKRSEHKLIFGSIITQTEAGIGLFGLDLKIPMSKISKWR